MKYVTVDLDQHSHFSHQCCTWIGVQYGDTTLSHSNCNTRWVAKLPKMHKQRKMQ